MITMKFKLFVSHQKKSTKKSQERNKNMSSSLFTEIDESFICENCGKKVEKLGYSCRNHCPYCLHSKHVDVNPRR